MKSIRTYQREIAKLKSLIIDMQWVMPTYNGSPSCSCCGMQEHQCCDENCAAAKISGNRGKPEKKDYED